MCATEVYLVILFAQEKEYYHPSWFLNKRGLHIHGCILNSTDYQITMRRWVALKVRVCVFRVVVIINLTRQVYVKTMVIHTFDSFADVACWRMLDPFVDEQAVKRFMCTLESPWWDMTLICAIEEKCTFYPLCTGKKNRAIIQGDTGRALNLFHSVHATGETYGRSDDSLSGTQCKVSDEQLPERARCADRHGPTHQPPCPCNARHSLSWQRGPRCRDPECSTAISVCHKKRSETSLPALQM